MGTVGGARGYKFIVHSQGNTDEATFVVVVVPKVAVVVVTKVVDVEGMEVAVIEMFIDVVQHFQRRIGNIVTRFLVVAVSILKMSHM